MEHKRLNMMTVQEAMDLLEVSRSTLDRWRKYRNLPYVKIGKEVFFDRNILETWVRQHTVVTEQTAGDPSEQEIITIGYQRGTAHMWSALVIKELHLLEDELQSIRPASNHVVRWHNASNGLQLVEGMIAGKIQIASLGDYPTVLAADLRKILPKFRPILIAFDGKSKGGKGISLVTEIQSKLMKPNEIIKASVATVPNTSAGYRLNKLLLSMKLPEVNVLHQEMHASMRNLIRGQVQASMMWEPYLSLMTFNQHGRVLFDDGLGDDYLTSVVADENWCRRHEAHVVAYLRAHLKAHRIIREMPQRAAQVIAKATRLPLAIALSVLQRVRWDASIYERDIATLNGLCETGLNCMSSDIHTFVKGEYVQYAARRLSLPAPSDFPVSGDWSREVLY
ncbi:helix-turn-helix domain-containing protein [Alicyclobacillus sp. SO9]|uniref:helix-turn-helix domain-containing protein n=1 Tax=Alicyclobacillus sp. SO9 TaxID=2665646 RepID=UPI0018E90217|nr:helix-turn-helix domain-containing protein [Alicyclobacillus sp. SO9]QQE78240.1 helix-turn-helix domain-containing protein [Alicyclobacillus sp. SO9]